ncbi:FAD-dependent oxidoreductase [Adlercreutzia mucosicola]|uniref:FAD-dependent oxidoreductase n=1 Tax=Adlercreutzia mucosicola TaxID=580026 RepID=UPI000416D460|nr:FAD-binding protein [Adlercreutzia mucosicola]MCI9495392.1 FAD-binding protein [Adlercreutzia mucosicola]MCR2034409.1 FAD-binding protein [Adlercreutzia mucosicola]MEB1813714.1 FAD-binding protein [Adlercreutzia mucosicola]
MTAEFTRRDMFKISGLAAAGLGGAALLSACSPSGASSSSAGGETPAASTGTTTVAGHSREGLPSFLAAPEPITDIADTKDFDVVIVGAGASGVPAAITARKAGATVALIQKEATAISQGNTATGILLDTSDEAGVEAVVSRLLKDHQYRGKREQVELWAKNSGEAIRWVLDLATAEGAQVSDTTMKWTAAIKEVNGYPVDYLSIDFGPKPYNTGNGMQVLADYAAAQGVEIFYNTEAKQLVGDAAGVTGVIAEGPDGIVQFNASKGVILATGDYQNDDDMMAYYLPDLANLGRKQMNKTGDGHKMAVWAGGAIEDITHTKMLHDFDGGPGSMADMPFLAVKTDGTRFCDETLGMSLMNNFLRSEADQGDYNQIFDSNYMTAAAEWPGKLFDPEAIKVYMPEEDVEKVGVFEDQIGTYKADTLEELAGKLGITDTAAFVKSVERYNECVAAGKDLDFGKEGKWLTAIDTPPFYGIHRHVRVSAIVSGVNVGPNMEVLAAETGEPIPGLFAIGNTAGNFYGGVDYSMYMPGLSLGRAHTQGYVTGTYVANL